MKRERGLRVKRGRILKRKRRTKPNRLAEAAAEVVAGRRAAILRGGVPSATTKYMGSIIFYEYIYIV